nr:ABC transporter substrate-binding protein [Micromonospora sp. DSM 115978]
MAADLNSVGLGTPTMIQYTAGSDSPERVARQVAAFGADALISIVAPNDFADILRAARSADVRLAVTLTYTGYDRRLLAAFGPALAGVSMPVYFRPFEAGGAAIDRYREAMTRFAPQTTPAEQQFAMLAYIHTDLFLRGLELAGDCPTREGFVAALRGVTDY